MRVAQDFNRHQALLGVVPRINAALATGQLHIALFSGTPPTDAQLQSLMDTSNGTFVWNPTKLAAFATSANFLADVAVDVFTPVFDASTLTHVLPISQQANNMVVSANGTPTWFLARYAAASTTTADFTNFAKADTGYVCLSGTVGDENSSADLRIAGGVVSTTVQLRPMDLRFKF